MQTSDLPLLDRYPDLALLLDQQGRPLYLNPSAKGLQQRLGQDLALEPGQSQVTFEVAGMPRLNYTLHWSRVDWQSAPAWMVFARRETTVNHARLDELEREIERLRAEQSAPATRVMNSRDAEVLEAELRETQRLLVDGLLASQPSAEWVERLEEAARGPSERLLELVDRNLRLAGLTSYYQARIRQFEHWQKEARQRIGELEQQVANAPTGADPHTQRLAYEDQLTNTPNANILLPYLDQMADGVERGECSVALLLIELDRLHNLNTTLGRDSGDALLRQIGQRVRAQMRPEDVLGRLVSGEFAVVVRLPLGGAEGRAPLSQMAAMLGQRILASVAEPVALERQTVETTASIGIVILQGATASADLVSQAQTCLRQARKAGGGRQQFFGEDLQQRHLRDLGLLRQLEGALERNEFALRFQPVVDLKTGKIVAAEALLRWVHPSQGLLEPSQFLEVADNAGFLVTVGEWVVKEACAQILALGKGLTAMVNVSSRQVVQADLARRLMKAWERSKMRAESLVIEIPEAILVTDPERTEKLGRELTRCRVQVAVDSFGADFASLKRIKRMNATFLKLDPALISKLPTQDDNYRLCRSAVLVAHSLGMQCVAKAVERKDQVTCLKTLGCHLAQGNFFAPAVSAQEFAVLLKKTWKL